ncbi:hypothetical protein EFR38_05860 [Lactobacillus delbrueckii subsp. lactis]|nr:hypothetical protein [Lactobacillus delbrueckii subsp. lactis]
MPTKAFLLPFKLVNLLLATTTFLAFFTFLATFFLVVFLVDFAFFEDFLIVFLVNFLVAFFLVVFFLAVAFFVDFFLVVVCLPVVELDDLELLASFLVLELSDFCLLSVFCLV